MVSLTPTFSSPIDRHTSCRPALNSDALPQLWQETCTNSVFTTCLASLASSTIVQNVLHAWASSGKLTQGIFCHKFWFERIRNTKRNKSRPKSANHDVSLWNGEAKPRFLLNRFRFISRPRSPLRVSNHSSLHAGELGSVHSLPPVAAPTTSPTAISPLDLKVYNHVCGKSGQHASIGEIFSLSESRVVEHNTSSDHSLSTRSRRGSFRVCR